MNKAPHKERSQAILIAGMHRSGTSALTKILSILGAELPSNLIPPMKDNNETGFWESRDLEKIHDNLLESGGSSWQDWSEFNPEWHETSTANSFEKQLLDYLDKDFDHSPQYVIKDPRICRFLPLWLKTNREFGSASIVIIPFRHPMEVAESLKKRDGMAVAKGLLLWLRHVIDAVHFSKDAPRSFVSFDNLLENWSESIQNISAQSGVTWSRKSALAELEVEAFLNPDNKHHSLDKKILNKNTVIPDYIVDVYEALIDLEKDGTNQAAINCIESIRKDFNQTSLIFAKVTLHEELLLKKQSELTDKNTEVINSLQKELADTKKRVSNLQVELDKVNQINYEAHQELDVVRKRNESLNQHHNIEEQALSIQHLNQKLQIKESEFLSLDQALQEKNTTLQALQALSSGHHENILAKENEIEKHKDQLAEKQSEYHLLELALTEKDKITQEVQLLCDQQQENIRAKQVEIDKHKNKLSEKQSEYHSLEQVLTEKDKINDEVQLRCEQQQETISTIENKNKSLSLENAEYQRKVIALTNETNALKQEKCESNEFYTHYLERKNDQINQAERLLEIVTSSDTKRKKYLKYLNNKPERLLLDNVKSFFRNKKGRNLSRDRKLIIDSDLFDPFYYLINNSDVLEQGIQPLEHYCKYGWKEMRQPSDHFDINEYIEKHPEAKRSGVNPLVYDLLFTKEKS